jgi:hypothetical protein
VARSLGVRFIGDEASAALPAPSTGVAHRQVFFGRLVPTTAGAAAPVGRALFSQRLPEYRSAPSVEDEPHGKPRLESAHSTTLVGVRLSL